MNFFRADPLLNFYANFVVQWIQFWVLEPQLWWNKSGCLPSITLQSAVHMLNRHIPAGCSQETDVDWGTERVCYAHLICLACLSIGVYCSCCGWELDFKDECRAMTIVTLIIAFTVLACDMHLCTISFDLWAPWYRLKTVIYGRQKSADAYSDELWKSSQIWMRTRNL